MSLQLNTSSVPGYPIHLHDVPLSPIQSQNILTPDTKLIRHLPLDDRLSHWEKISIQRINKTSFVQSKNTTYYTNWEDLTLSSGNLINKSANFGKRIVTFVGLNMKGWALSHYDYQIMRHGGTSVSSFGKTASVIKATGCMTGEVLYGASLAIAALAPIVLGGMCMFGGLILSKGDKDAGENCYYVGACAGGLLGVGAAVLTSGVATLLLSSCGGLETSREDSFLELKLVGITALISLESFSLIMGVAKDATTIKLIGEHQYAKAFVNDRFGYIGLSLMS